MHQKGFTILELLITIGIFSLMIVILTGLFLAVFSGSNQQLVAVDNVDNAKSVTSRFVNELRNATVGVDGSYQIVIANDNQVVFYSKSASGTTINRINYYLSGTTLRKGVTVPTGSPQTYNLANEAVTTVQKDVTNGVTSIFTYYDGNYNGSTSALTQPVNVNTIKYIKMNLIVLNQVKNQSTATFSITAGGTIRNLKNNLGN